MAHQFDFLPDELHSAARRRSRRSAGETTAHARASPLAAVAVGRGVTAATNPPRHPARRENPCRYRLKQESRAGTGKQPLQTCLHRSRVVGVEPRCQVG